ncbi:MAG: DUF3021 domain-containing protein [Arcanobacterium sp.]|nr:DUF3021 domain-containing protein [Arcanobacterium sp.]
MKNIIKASVYGLAIGTFVELLVSVIVSINSDTSVFVWATPAYLEQFGENTLLAAFITKATYALIGILSLAAAKIFDAEKLSLVTATLGNFALMLTIVGLAGFGLKWFPITIPGFTLFTGIFITIYTVIWIISYTSTARSIKEINTKLQASNS